jgi:hypothetical protein
MPAPQAGSFLATFCPFGRRQIEPRPPNFVERTMGRQRRPREFEERREPSGPRREPPSQTGDREHRATELAPIARSVLYLQRTAGNSAVATAIRGLGASGGTRPVVQRQPKVKKQPQWVIDAQVAFDTAFPNMKGVVIKDYAGLNKTLQGAHYGGWTQSKTEIYLRDPSKPLDPKQKAPSKTVQAMYVRYILQHESVHIEQFIKPGGPPTSWEGMLLFEKEAYAKDRTWLTGPGATIITDQATFDAIEEAADKNQLAIGRVVAAAGTLTGPAREKAIYGEMLKENMIPPGTDPLPKKLYTQP